MCPKIQISKQNQKIMISPSLLSAEAGLYIYIHIYIYIYIYMSHKTTSICVTTAGPYNKLKNSGVRSSSLALHRGPQVPSLGGRLETPRSKFSMQLQIVFLLSHLNLKLPLLRKDNVKTKVSQKSALLMWQFFQMPENLLDFTGAY